MREEACSDDNPWLVGILSQMMIYKARKGEAVHAVDKNTERKTLEGGLETNFISQNRSIPEISIKVYSERVFESYLRVWRPSSDWSTLALSSSLLSDPTHFVTLLSDISRTQAFAVPCRAVWSQKAKVWLRESPPWLSEASNSLAEYAAAATETSLWFHYWSATNTNPRRGLDACISPIDFPDAHSYPQWKEGYVDFWRDLDRSTKVEIIGNLTETAVELIRTTAKSMKSDDFDLLEDRYFSSVHGDHTYQRGILRHIREMDSGKSVEKINALALGEGTAGEFVELLFCATLDRLGSGFDAVAKHIGEKVKEAFQRKVAEDLALLDEAEQAKKQGKKSRDEPKFREKQKSKKKKTKKQRTLSDTSAVSSSTIASANTLSSHDEDENSYVHGLAVRLLDKAILSQCSPAAKLQIPELPDEDAPDEKETGLIWPLLPIPARQKPKKKKKPKKKPTLSAAVPISEIEPVAEIRDDKLTKDVKKFCGEVKTAVANGAKAREDVITAISGVCQVLFPGSLLVLFGSMSTGLALPSSDLDLSIVYTPIRRREEICGAIRVLGEELQKCQFVRAVNAITTATIPVVKLDCYCGVKVDCSFDDERHTGAKSSLFCIESIRKYPQMQTIALVLKSLLHQSGLNCAFLGGLSSYQLILWLVAFLQSADPSASEGQHLTDFFRFYGWEFDPKSTGINVNSEVGYFPLETDSFSPVVTLDPVSHDFNTTRNCTSIMEIQRLFADCYTWLMEMTGEKRKKGFVKRLLQKVADVN